MSESDRQRILRLLLHDIETTLGEPHVAGVRWLIRYNRRFNPHKPLPDLIDDVQQWVHDEFIDTTWPACSRHPNHPLWFGKDDRWWCRTDDIPIARLGELASRR